MADRARGFIAHKYASAFLAMYHTELMVDDVQKLKAFGVQIRAKRHLSFLLNLPQLADAVRRAGLQKLITERGLPESLISLVDLLLRHNRLGLFADIMIELGRKLARQYQLCLMRVASSHALDEQGKQQLEGFLRRHIEGDVQCTYVVDASLIAGIRAQSDAYVWERSIARSLRKARIALEC